MANRNRTNPVQFYLDDDEQYILDEKFRLSVMKKQHIRFHAIRTIESLCNGTEKMRVNMCIWKEIQDIIHRGWFRYSAQHPVESLAGCMHFER